MSEEKDDYSYWSENLHSAYLFYTLEVDKLNKENKQMREALEKVKKDACCSNGDCEHCEYDEDCFGYDAQQAFNKGGE